MTSTDNTIYNKNAIPDIHKILLVSQKSSLVNNFYNSGRVYVEHSSRGIGLHVDTVICAKQFLCFYLQNGLFVLMPVPVVPFFWKNEKCLSKDEN